MSATRVLRAATLVVLACIAAASAALAQSRPNIVVIYADDLGYGDVSAYGAKAVRTPNIASLAREGLRFTDAHATASTCTPSRYALLTGQYAWRKPGTNILPGDAALVIDRAQPTLPGLLKRAGYTTGVVGKWHLGLGPQGGPDWNGTIAPSPNDVGFDESFIMAATGDRVPTVYVRNGHVVGLDPTDPIIVSYRENVGSWPTGAARPDLLELHPSHGHDQTIVNGVSRIGYMTGGQAALWKDEDMSLVFAHEAVAFLERRKDAPFFLYFAPHNPHVPRVVNPRFVGATAMGPRGDSIVELDWAVGEVLAALDRLQLTSNTLVIFSSDNGPVVDDGYKDDAVAKLGSHKPAGPFRGGKYSSFEAGTRVPMIVRWPARVKPGVTDALVSHVDLLASLAAVAGAAAPAGLDSIDQSSALTGATRRGREEIVEQGGGLALRIGTWKYIAPNTGARINTNTNTELGNDAASQLYDLARDPGETRNLATSEPERVKSMAARLDVIRQSSGVK